MEVYETEEQQVEALKKWWKQNGTQVVLGLVIGIGGIVGWKSWQTYNESRAVASSSSYQQMVDILSVGDVEQARLIGESLVNEFPDGAYAALASLVLAKVAVAKGELDQAGQHLQWVMDHAGLEELAKVARLRMAKLKFQQGQLDEALALTEDSNAGSFQAAYAELRGDLLVAKGKRADARVAYQQALDGASAANRDLLQMKLDDLGGADEGVAADASSQADS